MENMTTIAIMNQKGGVCKTTTVIHVGVGLAALGYRVLMIDTDPQGHLSAYFNLYAEDGNPIDAIFHVLCGSPKLPIQEALLDLPLATLHAPLPLVNKPGRLALLPGYNGTSAAALQLQLNNNDFRAFGRAVEPVKADFDFILIDTSPTVALLTPAILVMSDYLLIPTEAEKLSMLMIEATITSLANITPLSSARVLGIVPTKIRANLGNHEYWLDQITAAYGGLVWNECAISLSTMWAEASNVGQSVFEYAPKHQSAEQGWGLVKKILEATRE